MAALELPFGLPTAPAALPLLTAFTALSMSPLLTTPKQREPAGGKAVRQRGWGGVGWEGWEGWARNAHITGNAVSTHAAKHSIRSCQGVPAVLLRPMKGRKGQLPLCFHVDSMVMLTLCSGVLLYRIPSRPSSLRHYHVSITHHTLDRTARRLEEGSVPSAAFVSRFCPSCLWRPRGLQTVRAALP